MLLTNWKSDDACDVLRNITKTRDDACDVLRNITKTRDDACVQVTSDEHLLLLFGRYVPTKVIVCATRISLGGQYR